MSSPFLPHPSRVIGAPTTGAGAHLPASEASLPLLPPTRTQGLADERTAMSGVLGGKMSGCRAVMGPGRAWRQEEALRLSFLRMLL